MYMYLYIDTYRSPPAHFLEGKIPPPPSPRRQRLGCGCRGNASQAAGAASGANAGNTEAGGRKYFMDAGSLAFIGSTGR